MDDRARLCGRASGAFLVDIQTDAVTDAATDADAVVEVVVVVAAFHVVVVGGGEVGRRVAESAASLVTGGRLLVT